MFFFLLMVEYKYSCQNYEANERYLEKADTFFNREVVER